MKYCFDEKIDRSKNHSAKWAELGKKFGTDDLFPMWIADMDIKTAPEIVQAMKEKVEQEIFGYVYRPNSYYKSAVDWLERRFGYKISEKTLIHSPGVVPSLSILVKLMTNEDEKILIQTPVYYPFAETIKDNNRTLVTNELVRDENGYYTMNFDDLEEKLSDEKVTLFILCSPHNPVGRVWKKEELEKVAEIAVKNNLIVVSDEIWADLIMPGYEHYMMGRLGGEIEERLITCTAPSKTFNLAGLATSSIIIKNKEIREKYSEMLQVMRSASVNILGFKACEIAYNQAEKWLEELITVLDTNQKLVKEFFEKKFPKIKARLIEGTYLQWLDFKVLEISDEELERFMHMDAQFFTDEGYIFGEEGSGYERINLAAPTWVIEAELERLGKALEKIYK